MKQPHSPDRAQAPATAQVQAPEQAQTPVSTTTETRTPEQVLPQSQSQSQSQSGQNTTSASIRKKRASLWRWISLRVVGLVLVAQLIQLAVSMVLTSSWDDDFLRSLTPELKEEVQVLRETLDKDPSSDITRLQEIYTQYLVPDLIRVDSEQYNTAWRWYLGMILTSLIPVILICLWFARRLSRQLGTVAASAGQIAQGDFSSRAETLKGAPPALEALTEDFNQMAERLERYDQELQVSSAAIAHELRTPLTAAKGRLQAVIDGVFPAEPRHFEVIMRQLDQMDRLVEDLYLLSLASANQLVLVPEAFHLRALIDERCTWVAHAIEAHGLRLEIEVADTLILNADRHRIGQLVSILIDNALRYAAGGGWIRIRTHVGADEHGTSQRPSVSVPAGRRPKEGEESPASMISLIVEDAGPGFPPQDIERVCDRFWRAEHSRSRHKGGSGLGLAVASAISRAHGGSLSVSNRPEGGGMITVQLPR